MKRMTFILLAITLIALAAFAGPASAKITSPPGTTFSGTIRATATNIRLDQSFPVDCSHSLIEGTVAGGATTGAVTALAFTGCGDDTVTVLNKGHLFIHGSGTVTSTGAEITTQVHRSIPFFPPGAIPVTTHCIYKTNNTDIGTLTEGIAPAKVHISSAPIPEVATDSLCSDDLEWTGTYTVNYPAAFTVD